MLENTLSQLLSEIYRLTIENKNLNDAVSERDARIIAMSRQISDLTAERDKANEVMISASQQLAEQDVELNELRHQVSDFKTADESSTME